MCARLAHLNWRAFCSVRPMTRIVPISGSAFPHPASRPRKENPAAEKAGATETRAVTTTGSATATRRISAHPGPTASFLAQYVDQHWPWPRDPAARIRARQTAAKAYAETEAREQKPARPLTQKRSA